MPIGKNLIFSAKIVLFDVDGTLVDVVPIHLATYQKVFRDLFSIQLNDPSILTREMGKPAPQLITAILTHFGVSKITPRQVRRVQLAYRSSFPTFARMMGESNVLPGVREMLTSLKKQGKVLGVVTGNSSIIGKAILKRTNLLSLFDVTAFSDEKRNGRKMHSRAEIIQLAMARASLKSKAIIRRKDVVVVGDSPFDIEAARKVGVKSLAVATGHFSTQSLKKSRPTVLIRSFKT